MKKQHVNLSESDKVFLEELLSRGSLKVRKQKRATALLELNRGKTLVSVSQTLGVSYPTVLGWRDSYEAEGLLFLDDKPRSGRPVELSGEQRAKITALACSKTPEGRAKWSLRLLADKAVELGFCEHVSYGHVRKILKKRS
jgi:transposase